MEYKFAHSLVVMGKLALDTARTPPSEHDPPLEYVDRSLTILGRKFDARDQEIHNEFLGQRLFIASQVREVETRIDGRFQEMEKKMDERFLKVDEQFQKVDEQLQEMEKKTDARFEHVDKRFDKHDIMFRDMRVEMQNSAAITRNGRLRRMHQPIGLIKVLRPGPDPNHFVWDSHPEFPKHMKNIYILGQRAKGVFEPNWEGILNAQKADAKRKALDTITDLAKFYGVSIWSDDQSESDATEVILQDRTVDEYMEALLDEWGMDWQKVLKLGTHHMQAPSQQAGAKRAGDPSSRGEVKKTR